AAEVSNDVDQALDLDQAPEIDWGVEGETLDQAPALTVDQDDVELQLDEPDEQQRIEDELAAEAAAYYEDRRVEAEQAPEIDWGVEGETLDQAPQAEETPEVTDVPHYRLGPELDAALAAYEREMREQAVAAREDEPEYDAEQLPELNWEIEGETYEERPETHLQPEVPEEEAGPAVTAEAARELYERQLRYAEPEQENQQEAGQQLPAQLADLQEDLDKANGALAEIAARQAERDAAALADDVVRAEQAEVIRAREVEAEVAPQIQQEQGPIISR
ncbi:hypothetical protein ACGFMO_37140, partial [Streptomyces niveus]|uniref:hypothetical protein n=1 Tax=Streptomyces niveus TaxID=193462 RepID=UPI00371F1E31